ncbi:hypothetical protein DH2020_003062 [Rehmannia glutinosa]|uniref:Endonuclease/exonuclease/phosphatase domain-containing protein n=1 Tax=Rehmannia glutinosa TaxID=99300 RepID=A0ABR0XKJ7_REHGL
MNLLSWNCRGLGNQATVRALKKILREKNQGIVFLMETKLNDQRMATLNSTQFHYAGCFSVNPEGDCRNKRGGLSILWKNPYDLSLVSYSNHHISVTVKETGDRIWELSYVYGWPNHHMKRNTWQLLRNLNPGDDKPWVCISDFNEIMWPHEKIGGNPKAFACMESFRNVVDDCTLLDLGFSGNMYTWTNGQAFDQNTQKKRLDRALATETWRDCFPKYQVEHLPRIHSDHAPLIVYLDGADKRLAHNKKQRKKLFRFESIWLEHEGCTEVVKLAWTSTMNGPQFEEKVKACSLALQQWDNAHCGKPHVKIAKLQKRLEKLQNGPQTDLVINECKKIESELDAQYRLEEIFWHQRSRALWIKAGDRTEKHRKETKKIASTKSKMAMDYG